MLALKDVVKCPQCGGREIVYSCEPKCCFNHVCADCRSTFEINAEKTGRFDQHTALAAEEPASGEPTTGCPNCDSLKVSVISTDKNQTLLLCGNCRAVSRMVIAEFVPGFPG